MAVQTLSVWTAFFYQPFLPCSQLSQGDNTNATKRVLLELFGNWRTQMKKIIFPDARLLLHFSPLDEIDLLQLLDCTEVDVLFTLIVTEELVRCQWEHPVRELRQQAKRRIKQIEAWLEGQHAIRRGVTASFLGKRPDNDTMKRFDLNWQHQDDLLLGTILEYKQAYADQMAILLTGDSNLAEQARVRGIEAMVPASKYKLAATEKALSTENQRAQQALASLHYRAASLSLFFVGGQDEITVTLTPQLNSLPATMQAQLVAVADNMHRERAQPRYDYLLAATPDDLEALAALAVQASPTDGGAFLGRMAGKEAKRYQEEVEAYPEKFEQYLHRCLELMNEHRRTIRLDLALANGGGAPAEKVLLTLIVPEQLEWHWQLSQDHMPAPPTPPIPPRSEGWLRGKEPHIGKVSSASSHLLNQDYISGEEPGGALPVISEAGTKLQWELGSYHQRESRPLGALHVRFRTAAEMAHFTITYTVQESNSPHPARGQLLVFVNGLSNEVGR